MTAEKIEIVKYLVEPDMLPMQTPASCKGYSLFTDAWRLEYASSQSRATRTLMYEEAFGMGIMEAGINLLRILIWELCDSLESDSCYSARGFLMRRIYEILHILEVENHPAAKYFRALLQICGLCEAYGMTPEEQTAHGLREMKSLCEEGNEYVGDVWYDILDDICMEDPED